MKKIWMQSLWRGKPFVRRIHLWVFMRGYNTHRSYLIGYVQPPKYNLARRINTYRQGWNVATLVYGERP